MENYVSAQLLLLGQAALLGMLGGVVYDLLRPLRRGRLIHLTDALFTGGGLVLMVWFLTAVSRGEARLFLLLGACGGTGLYFLLLAPLLRPLWDFWAAAAAAWAASATPVPRAAERTTTGHPSRRDSRSRFSFWPRRSSRSARFTATTMGIPSSSSWVVR